MEKKIYEAPVCDSVSLNAEGVVALSNGNDMVVIDPDENIDGEDEFATRRHGWYVDWMND